MYLCIWKILGGNFCFVVFGHLTTQSFSPIMWSIFILSICLEVFPEENMIEVEHFLYQNKLCVHSVHSTALNISINCTVKIH